jgi:hypothetical protein
VSAVAHGLACRDELLAAVEQHQILILVAETGAGKTTQVRHQWDEGHLVPLPQTCHTRHPIATLKDVTQPYLITVDST